MSRTALMTRCSLMASLAVSLSVLGDAPAPTSPLEPLVALLARIDDPAVRRDLLRGMHKAIEGRRRVPMPRGWRAVYPRLAKSPDAEVRRRARLMGVIFGDQVVIGTLNRLISDAKAPAIERLEALGALVQTADRALLPTLIRLISISGRPGEDRVLVSAALRGLAVYQDERVPRLIIDRFDRFSPAERRDAIGTLAARTSSAIKLLKAVESAVIARREISAFTARQIAALGDAALTRRLEKSWGRVRPTATDKKQRITGLKRRLTAEAIGAADRRQGRRVFSKTCANCHMLFGAGRKVGPDLTGAQRTNLDYLLENLVDPNALVGRDYQLSVIATSGGRVVTGVVSRSDDRRVTVQTANEDIVIPRDEIEVWKRQNNSMMPEGMLEKLSTDDLVALFAYLSGPGPVRLDEK